MKASTAPKKRRTLKIADAELEQTKSRLEYANEKLTKMAIENAKLKALLSSYIQSDDSLLCNSQLREDEQEENVLENPADENITELSSSSSGMLLDDTSHSLQCTPLSQDLNDLSQLSDLGTKGQLEDVLTYLEQEQKDSKQTLNEYKAQVKLYEPAHHVVRVGVGVLLTSKRHKPKSILIGERRGSHGSGKLALPGGHLEVGESWEECAARELKEETDLDLPLDSFSLFYVSNDYMEDESRHYITIFMKADLVDEDSISLIFNMEPDKCVGWEWQQFGELEIERLFIPMKNLVKYNSENVNLLFQ